jgi:PAS domain S-box-containing protein
MDGTILRCILALVAALVLLAQNPALSAAPSASAVLVHPDEALVRDRVPLTLDDEERRFLQSLPPLRVIADDDFAPLSRYNAGSGAYEGMAVELFAAVARRLGIQYSFLREGAEPWSQKFTRFREGKADLILPVSITAERQTRGVFTTPFYESNYGAVARKDRQILLDDSRDLAGFRVGLVSDTAIVPYARSVVPEQNLFLYPSDAHLYRAVQRGGVDLALQNRHVFAEDRFNKELFDLEMVHVIRESPRNYAFYLSLTPMNVRLAALMDRCLAGLDYGRLLAHHERGWDNLVLRYLGQKQEKKFLTLGIAGSVALLAILGLALSGHRRLSARLAESLTLVSRQKEELRESERSYRAQFARNSTPMILFSPGSGAILDANEAALAFYGYGREALLALHTHDLAAPGGGWPDPGAPELARPGLLSARHRLVGGAIRDVEVSVSPIHLGGHTVVHAIIQDVTERIRAERQRADIERIAHHDLRSPAASAVNLARLLSQNPALSEPDRELLRMLENVSQGMLDSLDAYLELSRIEAGVYVHQPRPVAIQPLVREVAQALLVLPRHQGKGIVLSAQGIEDGDYPGNLAGAPFLLRRILQNLIGNALEASPPGGRVVVDLSGERECTVTVRNQGAVPPGMRERFFEKYATQGKAQGTGLGTYSARLMTEAQGGKISMRTSDETDETEVAVTLPGA